MIKEDELLDRTGIELPVVAQLEIDLRLSVRLAAGVQAVHVRLEFLSPNDGVADRGQDEEVHRDPQDDQRQACNVADPAQVPALSPPAQAISLFATEAAAASDGAAGR